MPKFKSIETDPIDLKDQLKSKACFVAGTLVHTKEGLRPIEEIKVGDYVLSKPESGEGELSYQRVTRTFVHENQEVWALRYDTQRDPVLGWVNPVGGWLVATKNHPIWQVYAYSSLIPTHVKPSKPSQRWLSIYEHYEETAEGYGGGGLLLASGGVVEVDRVYPLVQNEEGLADIGVMFDEASDDIDGCHSALDFSNGEPKWVMDENELSLKSFYVSNTTYEDNEFTCTQQELDAAEPDSITDIFMRRPFLRTVYNLEVENTHTYFVGEHGVWVHNTCEDTILKDYLEAQATNQWGQSRLILNFNH